MFLTLYLTFDLHFADNLAPACHQDAVRHLPKEEVWTSPASFHWDPSEGQPWEEEQPLFHLRAVVRFR